MLSIADRLSVFFPGCTFIVDRFRNPQLNSDNDQSNSWNPFVVLINNYHMKDAPNTNTVDPSNEQIQTDHPFMTGEGEAKSPSFSSSDSTYSPDGNLQFNPEEFMFDDLKSSIDMF